MLPKNVQMYIVLIFMYKSKMKVPGKDKILTLVDIVEINRNLFIAHEYLWLGKFNHIV